jgi:hypothetical protein
MDHGSTAARHGPDRSARRRRALPPLAAVALWSCASPGHFAAAAAAPAADARPAPPRIAVADGALVARPSGRRFHPRGFNYIRLRPKWHGTFAPGRYDPARAEAMVQDLARGGFNAVRVFIDPAAGAGVVASRSSRGLSKAYLSGFLDFLRRARRHGVYVVASLLALPACERYNAIAGRERRHFGHGNEMYFDPSMVRAKAQYCADFVAAVRSAGAALPAGLLACELDNETHFFAHAEPFSSRAAAHPWGGRSYDLRDGNDLQALADEAVVRWADACVEAVRRVDPRVMVSVNVFTFRAVGRSGPGALRRDKSPDRRFPARPLALARSKIDYLDIHFYPFADDTLAADLRSIEFDRLAKACRQAGKPLIMGEFGAFKKAWPTLPAAAEAMTKHLRAVQARGFAGFLYWTYDTDEQPFLWNARNGKGEIFDALRAEAAAAGP